MLLRKKLLFIVILSHLLCFSVNAEETDNSDPIRFYMSYSYDYDSAHRFEAGFSEEIVSRIWSEDCVFGGATILYKDRFNSDEWNLSLAPFINPVSGLTLQAGLGVDYPYSLIPSLLTNSYIFLPITYDVKSDSRMIPIALFIKNESDVFLFQSTNWAQTSPGAGVRVYVGGTSNRIGVSIGWQKTFQRTFNGQSNEKTGYYIRIGTNNTHWYL